MPEGPSVWFKITMLTLCASLLTLIALPDFSSVDSFALHNDNATMIDFYERAAHNSGTARLDTIITIVAIDSCSHDEIAEVLDLIYDCQPKAIGLDVMFYSLDNDSLLKAALKNTSSILTLPININEPMPSESFVNEDTLHKARFGRVDLAQEHRGAPIRHFFMNVDNQPSFIHQLALSTSNDIDYADDIEPLRYGAREFNTISGREILDHGKLTVENIRGKIVIIGAVEDYIDMHYTPIDTDMPGVKVHAYSLATLLAAKPVKSFPVPLIYFIALLFTFITIWLCMKVDGQPYSNFVSRIIPIGIVLVFIYICYHFYNTCNLYIDFTIVLAMTASGMLCYDLYTGLPAIIRALWQKIHITKQ